MTTARTSCGTVSHNKQGEQEQVWGGGSGGVYLPGILARCLGTEREQLLPIIPKKTVLGFHVVGVYVQEPAYLLLLEIGAFGVEEVEVRLSVGNVSRHTIKAGTGELTCCWLTLATAFWVLALTPDPSLLGQAF
jgi:hypothetical protein